MYVLIPRSCLGHFTVLVDIEGEPLVTLGASCFHHKEEKLYLYRSKYGHWCIGGYSTAVQYSKVQYGTVQYTQYSTVPYSTVKLYLYMSKYGRWCVCVQKKGSKPNPKLLRNCLRNLFSA